MARVKGGYTTRQRRKKVLKLAKGYYGAKHLLYKTAHEQVMHSFKYAYNDRKDLKREMRKLWIARINAAARMNDISYSRLMHGLKCCQKLLFTMKKDSQKSLKQQRLHWKKLLLN